MINRLKKVSLSSIQRQSFTIGLTSFSTGLLLFMIVSILALVATRGLKYFWPQPVYLISYHDQRSERQVDAFSYITAEPRSGTQYQWRIKHSQRNNARPKEYILEDSLLLSKSLSYEAARIQLNNGLYILGEPMSLLGQHARVLSLQDFDDLLNSVNLLAERISSIRANELTQVHELLAEYDQRGVALDAPARHAALADYEKWQREVDALERQINGYRLQVRLADHSETTVLVRDITDITYPSAMGRWDKLVTMFGSIATFLTTSPQQANTAGGVFPALFGTVLMVMIMTVLVTPFGVLTAVYLVEYAPDNFFTGMIRTSVSNMAAVPSIVYGVFGLGFLVYSVGGTIDSVFFSEKLPAPTLGSPGLFWASLTMALLTLPVVIVSTEEGLRRVPKDVKAGSYALGATKIETIWNTVLPIASPGIMTGVILAIARAAGEVAPLMLVGAVKFAPALPLDASFPFLHLDRQFMHLGVLIYDGAFHSQTHSSGSSMMFAACLLLLVVVFILNLLAVILRFQLRSRYTQR